VFFSSQPTSPPPLLIFSSSPPHLLLRLVFLLTIYLFFLNIFLPWPTFSLFLSHTLSLRLFSLSPVLFPGVEILAFFHTLSISSLSSIRFFHFESSSTFSTSSATSSTKSSFFFVFFSQLLSPAQPSIFYLIIFFHFSPLQHQPPIQLLACCLFLLIFFNFLHLHLFHLLLHHPAKSFIFAALSSSFFSSLSSLTSLLAFPISSPTLKVFLQNNVCVKICAKSEWMDGWVDDTKPTHHHHLFSPSSPSSPSTSSMHPPRKLTIIPFILSVSFLSISHRPVSGVFYFCFPFCFRLMLTTSSLSVRLAFIDIYFVFRLLSFLPAAGCCCMSFIIIFQL